MEPIIKFEPELGLGATMGAGSDRYPYTIVEISENKKRIGVRRDKATRIDNNGLSENQDYVYTQTEGPAQEYYTLRENGTWVRDGELMRKGTKIYLGHRSYYQDPSF